MLIVAQQVDHGGHEDDAAADTEQSDKHADREAEDKYDEDLHNEF